MKQYKIHKQVKTLLGGQKIDLVTEGDNKDELVELIEALMPDPWWVRFFERKQKVKKP